MNGEEKDALRAAMRQMFDEHLNPYRAVSASLAREIQREKSEQDWWNQFLPGRSAPTATVRIAPPGRDDLRITYEPDADRPLAAGEIVWTWVPSNADGSGAYSPVLILGNQEPDRFFAVRMTPVSHKGAHRYLPIGAGPKDSRGRLSWVDIDHILSVHNDGVRREGFIIDRNHFTRVADELRGRYGWAMTN